MDLNSEQMRIETIKKFMKKASNVSEQAHEILFADLESKKNEIISAIYLNKAISIVSSAKAIYYSDYENLYKPEVEEVFAAFDEFNTEFLECLYSGHSHQWTDINFNRYKELSDSFFGSY